MKRTLSAALLAAGLMMGVSALAQVAPGPGMAPGGAPGTVPDTTGTYDTGAGTGYDTGTGTGYRTTGWDPSLMFLASGGLAAGSLALKGVLRKRA